MAKKLTLDFDMFEEIEMIGIVSPLKDYRLAYFINKTLEINLKKYDDFQLTGTNGLFSWYYYNKGNNNHTLTLIENIHQTNKLIADYKTDYLLLVKNVFDPKPVSGMITKLRTIPDIFMVFQMQLSKIKNIDILLESVELHELKQRSKS